MAKTRYLKNDFYFNLQHFMIYASLAWILIIIWKPYRSITDQLSD